MRSHRLAALICLFTFVTPAPAQRAAVPADTTLRLDPAAVRALRETIETQSVATESAEEPAIVLDRETLRRLGSAAAVRSAVIEAGPEILAAGQSVYVKREEPAQPLPCSRSGDVECMESQISYVTTTASRDVVNLSLIWESTRRLRMTGGTGFTGEIFLQLRNVDAPDLTQDLSGTIQVAVSALVDSVDPGPIIEFGSTNQFVPVTLSVGSPQDPTIVRFSPANSTDAQEVTFEVTRPTLDVSIGRQSILGFGLETTTVSVRANGVDSPAGAVSVTTQLGNVNRNDVPFDGNLATTFVRSSGTGTDTILARLENFEEATATVVYRPPWSWLIAVLLGAIAGVAIRITMRAKAPGGEKGIAFNVVLGLIGGLLTAMLYGLGVNILPLPLPGGFSEGLAFVLSALGAWVFPKWLEGLAPKAPAEG